MNRYLFTWAIAIAALAVTGCAANRPYDYTNFRAYPPRSIVVLPPLNESTDIKATYGYLSTVTRSLAEMGYYVFPVAEVDGFMKENGLPTAGEMHQVPLDKIHDVFGADAVLYVTIRQYGQKYQVISSRTIVWAEAKLVDVKTGTVLWEGKVDVDQASDSGGGGIIGALVSAALTQVVESVGDPAHDLCPAANAALFMRKNCGLLPGPYFPKDRQAQP